MVLSGYYGAIIGAIALNARIVLFYRAIMARFLAQSDSYGDMY